MRSQAAVISSQGPPLLPVREGVRGREKRAGVMRAYPRICRSSAMLSRWPVSRAVTLPRMG